MRVIIHFIILINAIEYTSITIDIIVLNWIKHVYIQRQIIQKMRAILQHRDLGQVGPMTYISCSQWSSIMSFGGLAVKHPALGANEHRFEPRKRWTLPEINFSAHNIVADHVK